MAVTLTTVFARHVELEGLAAWQTHAWPAEPQTAIYTIMLLGLGGTFVGFPFVVGLNLLIYLAGLDNIPGDMLD